MKLILRWCYFSVSAFILNLFKSFTFIDEEKIMSFFLSRVTVITISVTKKSAKSYCSRIQDYLKNQKMSMGMTITFSMLLLLVRMSNNKHIKLFSRTEGHL